MKYKTRFLLFFVAMALFHLASNFAHPVTPTIIQELGLPDYMFGLMLAVMMIANFALSPSWGNINRFISSRESLLICCVGYAAAICALARAQGIPTRIVNGHHISLSTTDGFHTWSTESDITELDHWWNECYVDGHWITDFRLLFM